MKKIKLIDTTLRDGEQAPGVSFTKKEKLLISKKIDELGVDVIEVGIAAMGLKEIEVIRSINELDLKAELMTWNRMRKSDIDMSVLTGVKNAHISVPASDIHITRKLGMNRKEVLKEMCKLICYSINKGLNISIGAEDASRADNTFLKEIYTNAVSLGVGRVRYADTLGILTPFKALDIIKHYSAIIPVQIDFHGHNDLGMGTANALAAFIGGADYISCSINGLGERAGNTALEEIVAALTYTEKAKTNIKKNMIPQVSKIVEKYSGKILSDLKPIVGENVFSHESGIHVDGLMKDSKIYEALIPEDYGRKRQIILGKFSGKASVIYKMKELGYEIDNNKAQHIIDMIRKYS